MMTNDDDENVYETTKVLQSLIQTEPSQLHASFCWTWQPPHLNDSRYLLSSLSILLLLSHYI